MLGFRMVAVTLVMSSALCYHMKYDELDLDDQLQCMIDKGPCKTPEAKEFKSIFAEILKTSCEKCSPKQKNIIRMFVTNLVRLKKDLLDHVTRKYDPENEHTLNFLKFIQGE